MAILCVCMYVYERGWVGVCVCVGVCVLLCVFLCMCACMNLHMYVPAHESVYACACVWLWDVGVPMNE
jgi:hypothetical protein